MTQKTANAIAQTYMQAGYTTHGAFLAMSDADMQFLEIVQVIDTMQAIYRIYDTVEKRHDEYIYL